MALKVVPFPKREWATRRALLNAAKLVLKGDMVGYAFIAWDRSGSLMTSYRSCPPVATFMLPEIVKDALNRRIAEDWTLETLGDPTPPDEPA